MSSRFFCPDYSFYDFIYNLFLNEFSKIQYRKILSTSFLYQKPGSGPGSRPRFRWGQYLSHVNTSLEFLLLTCLISWIYFWLANAEGEGTWTTNQGLYLSISIMSIPCLSPHTPQGLAPNTRYVEYEIHLSDGIKAWLIALLHSLFVTGWPMAAQHWPQLETLPGQSSSNTWRDTAALVARWAQQSVSILSVCLVTNWKQCVVDDKMIREEISATWQIFRCLTHQNKFKIHKTAAQQEKSSTSWWTKWTF